MIKSVSVPVCYVGDKLHNIHFEVDVPLFETDNPEFLDYLKGLDEFNEIFKEHIGNLLDVLHSKYTQLEKKSADSAPISIEDNFPDFNDWKNDAEV